MHTTFSVRLQASSQAGLEFSPTTVDYSVRSIQMHRKKDVDIDLCLDMLCCTVQQSFELVDCVGRWRQQFQSPLQDASRRLRISVAIRLSVVSVFKFDSFAVVPASADRWP
jgi:hypothetical protein